MKMNLNVTVTDCDTAAFEQGVTYELVERLLPVVQKRIMAVVEEQITAQIETLVAEATRQKLDAPWTPTDGYGVKKGDPISLHEYACKKVDEALKRKVDSLGRPAAHYEPGVPWLDYVVDKRVEEIWKDKSAEQAKRIKAGVSSMIEAAIKKEKKKPVRVVIED